MHAQLPPELGGCPYCGRFAQVVFDGACTDPDCRPTPAASAFPGADPGVLRANLAAIAEDAERRERAARVAFRALDAEAPVRPAGMDFGDAAPVPARIERVLLRRAVTKRLLVMRRRASSAPIPARPAPGAAQRVHAAFRSRDRARCEVA